MSTPKIISNIKNKVSKSGDTLTGPLYINTDGTITGLHAQNQGSFLNSYKENNWENRRTFLLNTHDVYPTLDNALQLAQFENGAWKEYSVLHSGNFSNYALPLTGGTVTGNVNIETGTVPCLTLRAGTSVTKILKNANASGSIVDGAHWQDYPDNNDATTYTTLKLNGKASAKYALSLLYSNKGSVTSYNIYGEHNKPNAADVGALALTGGTLIGTLEIKSAYPAFISTNTSTGQSMRLYHSSNSVILVNRNLADDSTNYRALYLHNSKGASSASNALVLQDCINGAATNHTLLHSGNYIYTLDNAYAKSVSLEYEQFDTLTDLGYATKNYCGYAGSGHLFVGREWGRDASGKNFGYQLRVSGWDGTLYTRSFDGWGTSWSQWYQYYSTRNIQKGSSSVPSLLPEDGIYIKY